MSKNCLINYFLNYEGKHLSFAHVEKSYKKNALKKSRIILHKKDLHSWQIFFAQKDNKKFNFHIRRLDDALLPLE